MPNIFRTKRPTNSKLSTQTEDEDPHQRQAPWPKVARSRDASNRCWPISREWNVLETPKLVRRLSTSRAICAPVSRAKVTRPTNAETGSAQYLSNGKPTKVKLGTQMEHEDPHQQQAPWPRNHLRLKNSRHFWSSEMRVAKPTCRRRYVV